MRLRWGRPPLRHHRLQSWLAVAAMAAAVSLPVVLLSVGGGVSAHELAALQGSGYELAVSASGAHGVNDAHRLSAQIDRLSSVAAASPVLSVAIDLFAGPSGARPVLAEGVVPAAFVATEGPTERGLFPAQLPLGDPSDAIHYAMGRYDGSASLDVMVSSPLAESAGLTVGASVVLSAVADRAAGTPFTVTGTFGVPPTSLGPTAAFAVVLPLSDLQVLVGLARTNGTAGTLLDAADTIQVALAGSASTDSGAIQRTRTAIQAIVPFYGVSTLTQQVDQLREASAVLTGFYLALSSVSLSVGLLFLTLILLRRVEAERRNIGIERAVGVSAGMIAGQTVRAGILLAGAGAVVGVAAGFLVVNALAAYGSPAVQTAARLAIFDPTTLALLVTAVLALSLIGSALATRSALRLSIPEALR